MATIETLLHGFSAATSEGSLSYCAVTLLRGEHITLVDVGYMARRALLIERLAAVGLAPHDIDRVVLTHAHWDHALNLLAFPNAEVIVHEDELAYTAEPHPQDWATPVWTADILARCRRVTAVRDGDDLEAGVRVLATPGHSPGSLTLLVQSAAGVTGVVGDALPSRASARVLAPRLVFFNEAAARASARTIVDTCDVIVPGHDRAFRSRNGSFSYIGPTSLRLLYPPQDEDGTIRASIDDAPLDPGPIIVASATDSMARADG